MQERLQKLIAQAGIASRRAAEELILNGDVTVNGEVVTELGTKADPETDHIKVGGKLINAKLERRQDVYILLNKPKGYLSSAADPEGRKLVTDIVKGYGKLHPVGRLDFNTEGLIILTNDGQFTNKVAASQTIPKVYEVKTKGTPTNVAINKLRRGTVLEDGFKTAPAQIRELKGTDKNGWYEVTLYEGHNQQIRKMFDSIGHSVVKLRRIAIGNITEQGLAIGASRILTEQEVNEIGNPPKKKPAAAGKPGALPAHSRFLKPKKTFKKSFDKKNSDEQGAEKRPTRGAKSERSSFDKPKSDPNRPYKKFDSDDREKRPARGARSDRFDRADSDRPKRDSGRPFGKFKADDRDGERRVPRGASSGRAKSYDYDGGKGGPEGPFRKYRSDDRDQDKRPARGFKSDRPQREESDRPKKRFDRPAGKPRSGGVGGEKRPARGGRSPAKRSR